MVLSLCPSVRPSVRLVLVSIPCRTEKRRHFRFRGIRRMCAIFGQQGYRLRQAVRVATQYASAPCKLTISSHLFARWHLFRHVGYLRHQQQVDLSPSDLESGVRVTCDVAYLCANFSLPRPLCSRLMPDVRDRQTDVRQTSYKSIA